MALRTPSGAAAAALLLALAAAGKTGSEGWLERLQGRLDGIRSFRARFVQEYEPRAFSRHQREGGVVVFRRPGKMRWDYEWPQAKLALCDGKRAWVYYPQEKRVEVGLVGRLGDEAPAVQLLLGRWRLRERFRLEGISRREGEVTLHLAPSPALEAVHALRLTIAEEDLTLRAVEAEDNAGNLLRYRFEEWEEGVDAPEELFRFTPPDGVRLEHDS